MRFLPEILALQKALVKRFQNVPEAEYQSLRGFISSHASGGTRGLVALRVAPPGGQGQGGRRLVEALLLPRLRGRGVGARAAAGRAGGGSGDTRGHGSDRKPFA